MGSQCLEVCVLSDETHGVLLLNPAGPILGWHCLEATSLTFLSRIRAYRTTLSIYVSALAKYSSELGDVVRSIWPESEGKGTCVDYQLRSVSAPYWLCF